MAFRLRKYLQVPHMAPNCSLLNSESEEVQAQHQGRPAQGVDTGLSGQTAILFHPRTVQHAISSLYAATPHR